MKIFGFSFFEKLRRANRLNPISTVDPLEIKYCEDCRHFILDTDFPDDDEAKREFARCARYPIDSGIVFVYRNIRSIDAFRRASNARVNSWVCGPQAKLFEPKIQGVSSEVSLQDFTRTET